MFISEVATNKDFFKNYFEELLTWPENEISP